MVLFSARVPREVDAEALQPTTDVFEGETSA